MTTRYFWTWLCCALMIRMRILNWMQTGRGCQCSCTNMKVEMECAMEGGLSISVAATLSHDGWWHCFISKVISFALLLHPGLGLTLSECKQWQSLLRANTFCTLLFKLLVMWWAYFFSFYICNPLVYCDISSLLLLFSNLKYYITILHCNNYNKIMLSFFLLF